MKNGRKIGTMLVALAVLSLVASLLAPVSTNHPTPRREKTQSSGTTNPLQAAKPSSRSTFSTTIPPIRNSVSVRPTNTITRRSDNQPVWLYDLNIKSKEWLGGKPAEVLKLKFTLKPNDLTSIISSENVSAFNENYRYCGRKITLSEITDLYSDLTEIPVHASIGCLENAVARPITPPTGGGTDWISQGESNPVTLTINLRCMGSPKLAKNAPNPSGTWGRVKLGSHSLLVTATSNADWSEGTFENTGTIDGDLIISRFEQMENMPVDPEWGHDLKYVEDGENMYANSDYTDLLRYSIKEDSWYIMASAPATIYDGGDMAYGGGDNLFVLQGNTKDNLFLYDMSADSWSVFEDVPGLVYQGGSIEYDRADDNIYVVQGNATDNLYCYDLDSGTWTRLTNSPQYVDKGGDMELVGDNIYVTEGNGRSAFLHYSIPSDSWTQYPDVPAPVDGGGDMAYPSDGENIYLQRGDGETGFYRYSVKDNAWYLCENFPIYVASSGSLEYVEAENSIYGSPQGYDNRVYRYCLDNIAYSQARHTTAKENWNGVPKIWENLQADVSIPSGATLEANVQVSDNFANYGVQDNKMITLSDGLDNYDISDLEVSHDEVRIVTNASKGTSDFGPKVHSYKLFGENSAIPKLETNKSENVDAYSADFLGELLDAGGPANDNIRIEIRESGGTWENFGLKTGIDTADNYSFSKSGLKDNTTYEWRFRGLNAVGENVGSTKTFTTDYPRVSFESKSHVTTGGFTAKCSVENRGEPSLDVYVQYREKGTANWSQEKITGAAGTKSYSTNVTGLKSDTEYEVRWKIVGSTYYSDTWTIKTKASGGGVPIGPTGPEPMSIDVKVGRLQGGAFATAKKLELGDIATVRIKLTSDGEPVEGADVGAWWIPKPTQAITKSIEISEIGGGVYQGSFSIPEDVAPGTYEVSAEAEKTGYEKAIGYDTFHVVRRVARPGPVEKALGWAKRHPAIVAVAIIALLLLVLVARE